MGINQPTNLRAVGTGFGVVLGIIVRVAREVFEPLSVLGAALSIRTLFLSPPNCPPKTVEPIASCP